jgi:hypothetical protein
LDITAGLKMAAGFLTIIVCVGSGNRFATLKGNRFTDCGQTPLQISMLLFLTLNEGLVFKAIEIISVCSRKKIIIVCSRKTISFDNFTNQRAIWNPEK